MLKRILRLQLTTSDRQFVVTSFFSDQFNVVPPPHSTPRLEGCKQRTAIRQPRYRPSSPTAIRQLLASAPPPMEEPTNSAERYLQKSDTSSELEEIPGVDEGLQEVEVEQTLSGNRNTAELLESGYSKDEVLRVLQESPLPLEVAVITPVEEENPINHTPDMVPETQ
ncbi:hypothetical protein L2E82_47962 [Cichorium intybus]|uniref:Uncharacterized protein n=1 Tax=Cichorium intybus TaxID=13427 RepID=A0ACB8YX73_CICIN|nr:hypothetical protein L2E82_47962 [Cichorium intybus]